MDRSGGGGGGGRGEEEGRIRPWKKCPTISWLIPGFKEKAFVAQGLLMSNTDHYTLTSSHNSKLTTTDES